MHLFRPSLALRLSAAILARRSEGQFMLGVVVLAARGDFSSEREE